MSVYEKPVAEFVELRPAEMMMLDQDWSIGDWEYVEEEENEEY